jgi:hypothetical protein
MTTQELIETLKLQATFINAGGYINQGNVMTEAAERLEELEKARIGTELDSFIASVNEGMRLEKS